MRSEPHRAEHGAGGPLYRRLVNLIRADIQSGAHPAGTLLPPEAELRERFGVSRHTVREALRQLRDEGLVASRQGAGTVVLRNETDTSFVHKVASIADLISYAEELRYQVEASGMVVAGGELAQRLQCPTGRRWLRIEGLRFARRWETPAAWTEVFVNSDYAGIGLYLGRRPGPLYLWVEEMYGRAVQAVEQVFSGTMLPPAVAGALGLETGHPAIEARRTYLLDEATVALIAFTLHPLERFRNSTVLQRSRA